MKTKICLLSSLLFKVKFEYMRWEVRERITSFQGLALFPVYLNIQGFQHNRASVLFIPTQDREAAASLARLLSPNVL